MLFIEWAVENKRGISKSAGALPKALPSRVCVAGGTDPLPEAGVEDQEKEEQFRAGLKTGSEVGTFLLGVKVSPGPDGRRCLRSVVFQLL